MPRLLAAAVLIGMTATAPAAHAAEPYMWGVGPRVGTNFLPGAYPAAFPRIVTDDRTVADPDSPVIEKVRGDVFLGYEAQYYVNGGSRIGTLGALGGGRRFFDAHALFTYDVVLQSAAVDFLVGGGAGFGTQRWRGEGEGRLRVPYFPLRVQAAGMIRADWTAFQMRVFAQYNAQSNHFYINELGDEIDVRGGFYPTIGLEFTVLFGDFEPPRPRKRN